MILSGHVECIVIWRFIRIFWCLTHLSEPRLFVGFWQPPHPFLPTIYEKDTKKNDHPAKKTQPLRKFFYIKPRDIGPPPEVSFPHLEEVAHEEHGGKTLHRNQATTSNGFSGVGSGGRHKFGATKTNMFAPKIWGKTPPGTPSVLFFKATLPLKPATIASKIGHLAFQAEKWWLTCGKLRNFPVSTDF